MGGGENGGAGWEELDSDKYEREGGEGEEHDGGGDGGMNGWMNAERRLTCRSN